jgi:hypothetical protein
MPIRRSFSPIGMGAYIMLTHQFREFSDRGVRTDPVDALVHHFFDFHGKTSIADAPVPHPFQLYNGSSYDTRVHGRYVMT